MTAAMTLNSPMHGSQRQRTKVLFSSKAPTPELPLLEEAADQLADLDDEQLLPAAAIDVDNPFTPGTTAPGSPDDDDDLSSVGTEGQVPEAGCLAKAAGVPAWLPERTPVELLYVKNTFLDYDNDNQESAVDGSRPRAVSDFTGLVSFKAEGIREACMSDLQLPLPQRPSLPEADAVNETGEPNIQYVPMWCHVEYAADGSPCVTPFEMADKSDVPTYYCEANPWFDSSACSGGTPWFDSSGHDAFHYQACSGDRWATWCPESTSSNAYHAAPSTNDDTLRKENSELKQELDALKEKLAKLDGTEKKTTASASNEEATAAKSVEFTTLLIEHLPVEICETDHLVEVFDRLEFSGCYDFVYVWKTEKGCSAIANFTDTKYGRRLARKLHSKTTWGSWVSDRECEVSWSKEVQGLDALVREYQDVSGAGLFKGGWPITFAQHKCSA